ncbi:MAG: dephospho-CoA kinase [Flavobacteriaceae bacterium]|nr:dephospho-CoA kinase [Flavobacteriaceae bacterium]
MIIGLTGGIGSGKSTVVNMFAEFNDIAIYIADIEAKKLMNTSSVIKDKLITEFGKLAVENNEVNRSYISSIVFNNTEKLKRLNAIIHPEVRKNFYEFAAMNANKSYIVYEAAILFEANADVLCDKVITVYTDKETRIKRVLDRDNTTREEVESRIKNQWKDSKKMLLSNYIIYNYNLKDTKLQVQKIHNILTNYR